VVFSCAGAGAGAGWDFDDGSGDDVCVDGDGVDGGGFVLVLALALALALAVRDVRERSCHVFALPVLGVVVVCCDFVGSTSAFHPVVKIGGRGVFA